MRGVAGAKGGKPCDREFDSQREQECGAAAARCCENLQSAHRGKTAGPLATARQVQCVVGGHAINHDGCKVCKRVSRAQLWRTSKKGYKNTQAQDRSQLYVGSYNTVNDKAATHNQGVADDAA